MDKLHIDIETYSSVDLKVSGIYKYAESLDFEILILCYSLNDGEIKRVLLALGETYPQEFLDYAKDVNIIKCAHNAMFERVCLNAVGINIPIEQWECTAVKSAYCGLPLGLEAVSQALNLGDKSKSLAGKNLIKFFSIPVKPTIANGKSNRNFARDSKDKFLEYVDYCVQDVVAEREIDNVLSCYEVCEFERRNYFLDQKINDTGIEVDDVLATAAFELDEEFSKLCAQRLKEITKLDNPNSPKQLIGWLNEAQDKIKITSIAKDALVKLKEEADGTVLEVMKLRSLMSKTSTKKFTAMLSAICDDKRIRGLFQFYGANKTGRFAGRLVQLQNLPVNRMSDLDSARTLVRLNDLEVLQMMYEDIPSVLSQLIRTALIAKENHVFAVSDFSAIEARVLSWLASEQWRMDVFATHGKIYEAAASVMFNVPIEAVTKSSDYRAKAKNAELALGYQGGLGAMKRMGGESMGLSDGEMKDIVNKWRKANPKIVRLWDDINECAIGAVISKTKIQTKYRGISFESDDKVMRLNLPSGRSVSYFEPHIIENRFGAVAIAYKNIDQLTKKWCDTETYGGKLVENIVQAISRDILVESMHNLNINDFIINMHVHDEIICEVEEENCEHSLEVMENLMKKPIPWAEDLILGAEGYTTKFYKKD